MDHTKKSPTVLSLCSGYGGLELGLERVFGEITVLTHVEIEAFAIANLVAKMEAGRVVPAPIWTDIKTLPSEMFRGSVDILTAGYPCQPFSCAGNRGGEDDPRHLWPFIREHIRVIRPGWVFFENVEGHLSKGIVQVLADLEEMAYRVECGVFSAAEVGAPHQRKRVFILGQRMDDAGSIGSTVGKQQTAGVEQSSEELADPSNSRLQTKRTETKQSCENAYKYYADRWPARPGEPQYEWEEPRVVADNKRGISQRRSRVGSCRRQREQEQIETDLSRRQRHDEPRQIKSELGRAFNGITGRVDRLRLLGNGVVPQTAEKAFRTLLNKINIDINQSNRY